MQIDTDKINLDTSINISDFVLNKIGAYVFLKDREGKYVYVNEITRELFGREMEQIIGCDDSAFFDVNELSELIQNDARVLKSGETIVKEERNTIKATGEIIVYRTVKQPVYNRNNEIIGLLGISTDITDIYNLKEELRVQATTDPLTKIYNRRFFLDTADRCFSESRRHDTPLSLVMMDIDFFKKINDSYGHPAGDAVLEFISAHILGFIRKEDIFARIGGEEFAILLPGSDLASAQKLAEKIRASISEQGVCGEWSGTIRPTLSLGVTSHHKADKMFEDMYVRADNALYEAKNKGRNRVCLKFPRSTAGAA